jgi:site-specific DNA-methyltransferase (adenine-specific)
MNKQSPKEGRAAAAQNRAVSRGGAAAKGTLYCGDNLAVLREHVADQSVDLIYLDPPFNSGRDYFIAGSDRLAFCDTWRWDHTASEALGELTAAPDTPTKMRLATWISLMRELLPSGMCAYITWMAPRLLELHRVLKETGTLYLHCSPPASSYLATLIDVVFGATNLRSSIPWKRTSAHNNANRPAPIHDTILLCTKSDTYTWNASSEMTDVWTDIPPIASQSRERLGYPTQKPRALLERIIRISSSAGDTVLDPVAGSGTTLEACVQLDRKWIGIEASTLAISIIDDRLARCAGLQTAKMV